MKSKHGKMPKPAGSSGSQESSAASDQPSSPQSPRVRQKGRRVAPRTDAAEDRAGSTQSAKRRAAKANSTQTDNTAKTNSTVKWLWVSAATVTAIAASFFVYRFTAGESDTAGDRIAKVDRNATASTSSDQELNGNKTIFSKSADSKQAISNNVSEVGEKPVLPVTSAAPEPADPVVTVARQPATPSSSQPLPKQPTIVVTPEFAGPRPKPANQPIEATGPNQPAEDASSTSTVVKSQPQKKTPIASPVLLPWPQFKNERDQPAYFQAMQDLLDTGLDKSRGGAKAAKKHFEQAQQISGGDPRLYYAYGLVLLKQPDYDAALKQFATAAGNKAYPYLPAFQAIAWVQMLRKDFDSGTRQLVRIAEELEQRKSAQLEDRAREESATWIGRVVGYLNRPGAVTKRNSNLVTRCETDLRATLKDDRLKAYERGKSAVDVEYQELQAVLSETEGTTRKQQQQQQDAQKRVIAVEKSGAALKKQEIQANADQAKKKLDEELGQYDKLLQTWQSEYSTLAATGSKLSLRISQLQGEIASIELSAGRAGLSIIQQQQIRQRQSLVRQLQRDYNTADRKAADIRQRALGVLAQRKTAVALFQRETGQLVAQNAKIAKLEKQLQKKARKVNKKRLGSSARLTSLRRKLSSLKTYVDLDFESEKLRILASYPLVNE